MDTIFSFINLETLKLVFGTGIFTVLLNQSINWLRESAKAKRENKKSKQYSSIRISVVLEKYAIKCFNNISETNLYHETAGHMGKAHEHMPIQEKFSDDIDWKKIDVNLCASILTLENEIEISKQQIKTTYDCGLYCSEDMYKPYCIEVGKCGYMALSYAMQLRKISNLLEFEPPSGEIKTLKNLYDLWLKDKTEKS